jgi:molybdenum cofactor cytidylyltransferase
MGTRDETSGVFAVVLAAGCADRFGSTKQLAEIDGVALVARAEKTAMSVFGSNLVLVLGHDWQAVSNVCDFQQGFFVVNDDYREGIGTSIATAMRSIAHTATAVVVLLADQPLITADHLRALCSSWSGTSDEIVATAYASTLGVPALFPRDCFADLANLAGDAGARHLLTDERFSTKQIVFEPAAVDIDNPEDLSRL